MVEQEKNKMQKEDLLIEIAVAMKDLFVAQVSTDEQGISLRFLNGQQFLLSLQEIE